MTAQGPDPSFFEQLSRAARSVLADAEGQALEIESKSLECLDPVTNADRGVEQALRQLIEANFPEDGIIGEELGSVRPDATRCWSIDPIDGTRAFICGLPTWATLVGLVEDGEHVAAMVDVPAVFELFVAYDGATARNGRRVRSSNQRHLKEARLATTDPYLFEGEESDAFGRVRKAVALTRYGLDATAYTRVATGGLDLVIESGLKRHDYDALIPLVRGAGGHIGDWEGGANFASGRIVAAASRHLYDEAVRMIHAR